MRRFHKLLQELKEVVQNHKPGDVLAPPPLLPSVEINGRRLSYAAMGLEHDPARSPVILLHGFGGFFMDWPRVMAPVSHHTRVYALDLPGWGFSEPNPNSRAMEDDVHVIRKFIHRMGLRNVILVGLSYGGGVAWASAALGVPFLQRVILLNPMPPHPLRYLRSPVYRSIFFMNLVESIGYWSHRAMNKSQYKVICRENLLNDRLLDSFYLDLAYLVIKQPKIPFMLGTHARGARRLNWNDWEHRLAGARVPVSILQGLDDRIFSLESARFLQGLIPHSELIEVPSCGHAMVFDRPKVVSDHILRFILGEQERPGAISVK